MQKVRGKEGEPRSNQVYLVAFMCSKFGTSFIFTKKSNVAKCVYDIFHVEMVQCCQKSYIYITDVKTLASAGS